MADKETTILEFVIDQDQLLKDAAASKRAILEVKNAQAELNKEFKKGEASIEDYTEQSVVLEKQLKDEQDNYNSLTKAIRTNSNSLDAQRLQLSKLVKERNAVDQSTAKGIKQAQELTVKIKGLNDAIKQQEQAGGDFRRSVGNYTQGIVEAAKEINIAGVSVGGLSTQLAAFATPATAAAGLLTGLTSLYASSSIGARDLENAQIKLGSAFTLASNAFGDLINNLTGGSATGEGGLFSSLVDAILLKIDPSGLTAAYGKLAAQAQFTLKQLEITQLVSQKVAKDALKSAEELSRVRDDETKSNEERLLAAQRVNEFLIERENELVATQKQRLEQLELLLLLDKNNLELQKEIKQTEFEIADIQEDSAGKQTAALQAIAALEKEILNAQREQAALSRANQRAQSGPGAQILSAVDVTAPEESARFIAEEAAAEAILGVNERLNQDLAKENERFRDKQIQFKRQAVALELELEERKLQGIQFIFGETASVFDQQSEIFKALASAETLISTYSSAQKSYDAFAGIPIVGPALGIAAAAAATIAGLARVAQINEIQFAEGGYTGPGGKYQPAGTVHKGEVVWSQADVSAMGGPHVVDAMRPTFPRRGFRFGYADGGVVTNAAVAETNSNIAMMNAIRNLPPAELSVKEFTRVQRRVQIKESLTRLGR